ncbi:hypothetical protein NKG05_06790 [Oerskovia sp. M15]
MLPGRRGAVLRPGSGPGRAGVTFFAGSVFFTLAAFVQLSLSGRRVPRKGTNRADVWDWWAGAVQLVGTLLFNLSTAQALGAAVADPTVLGAGGDRTPTARWPSSSRACSRSSRPGTAAAVGPDARTWHGTWLNLLGSVAFGASAVGRTWSRRRTRS